MSKRRHHPQPQYVVPPPALPFPAQDQGYHQQQPADLQFQNLNISSQPSRYPQSPAVNPMGHARAPSALMSQQQPLYFQQPHQAQQFQQPVQPMQPSASSSAQYLNQLYNTDLSRELPPPISDLSLPPPPIVLPPDATILPYNEAANAAPNYFRSTMNVIPNNNSLLKKSKLPLALIVNPYNVLHADEDPVPVASDGIVARCRRCRGYINPFVTLVENGSRWRCNFCNLLNDIPRGFEFDERTNASKSLYERHELNSSVVEFIASKEYMVRAPPPVVYVFIIDVSIAAVNSGLTATVARTILDSLDRIPNSTGTTKVAFIGVDSNLYYFKFDESLPDRTDILVVADIDDPFMPSPDGLLVNLKENREAIEILLSQFPSHFEYNTNAGLALGPALKAGHKMISNIGGKLCCFAASLPSAGEGKLSLRDEINNSGKPKEAKALLTAAGGFYKSFAVTCNGSQVSVDLFLTCATYQDVATLLNLPRYTAGQTHFYPAWSSLQPEDVVKLSREISDHLSMDIGLEAVLRVRGSTGVRMNAFYGNFFNRLSDLCAFLCFPRDQSYCIELSIEENLNKPMVYFQAAVLHSTTTCERRIRVMNLAIPTSNKLQDVYASADQLAITAYITHKAIEKALLSLLPDARKFIIKHVVEILSLYKRELVAGNVSGASPLQLSTNLRMLPLLLFSLTKHLGFRDDTVPSDHRLAALNNLSTMPVHHLVKNIYPTIYSLHDMPDECGLPEKVIRVNEETGEEEEYETGEVLLPDVVNDSKELWENFGLYLIDNATELFLWVSGGVVPGLVADLFGTELLWEISTGKTELPEFSEEESEFNYRVRQIVNSVRNQKDMVQWKNLYVVVGAAQDEPMEISQQRGLVALRLWANSCLVEDKTDKSSTYRDFLASLKTQVAQ